jgi:hypothetical protein
VWVDLHLTTKFCWLLLLPIVRGARIRIENFVCGQIWFVVKFDANQKSTIIKEQQIYSILSSFKSLQFTS